MKTTLPPIFLGCALAGALCALTPDAFAGTRTIRVVCYNIEDDINGATTPLPGLISPSAGGTVQQGGVLEGIGEEILGGDPAQPLDILALEETTSNPTTIAPIVAGLNAFYNSSNMYAMSTYQATESGGDTADGNGPNAMVYNTLTVQLVASVPVDPSGGTNKLGSSSGEYREVMRYEFAPAGVATNASNLFFVYVSHYKSGTNSSDLTYRGEEAVIIRNDEANNLPANARVLYVGDYNVTTSGEASYQTMLAANAPNGKLQGQGIDPLNVSGANNINWGTSTTNKTILAMESESATDLRYRDDFQVMTTNVYYGVAGGLSLVAGTYHTFGNNGSIAYQGSVVSGTDTALNSDLATNLPPYSTNSYMSAANLYKDLSTGSDHFPIVADYTIPIPDPPVASFNATPTNGVAPLTVTFTDTSTGVISNWFWNFGDSSTTNVTTTTVQHTYTNTGVYSVTEIVSGSFGSGTNTQSNYITVTNLPNAPYQFYGISVSNQNVTLSWQTMPGAQYGLEVSSNLTTWIPLVSNLVAAGTNLSVTTNLPFSPQFFRAYQTP